MQVRLFSGWLFFFLLFFYASAWADISGKTFRDSNANGNYDSGELGVSGITVTAYNATGALAATTTTGLDGSYILTGLTAGAAYRVEFTLQTGCNVNSLTDFAALNANVYGSSVQFVNDGAIANFALANPASYNTGPGNTSVFTPIYYNGDPLGGGTSATRNWFVGYPYNSTGTSTVPPLTLTGDKVGALWGVAYSKQANRIFASALVKRHIGLGPMGSGGIYLLQPTATSFNVTNFFDMDNNSFNTVANPTRTRAAGTAPAYGEGTSFTINGSPGTSLTYLGGTDALTGQPSGLGVVGSNAQRGLLAATNAANYDPAAFDQTGKVGLGDMDISDDGKYLFVTNLYQRKIFRLTLDNPANPTAVTAVSSWSLPGVVVNNGVLRPFGLKYYHDKLYVGAVTTGENGGANTVDGATDLYAYVFQLNNPVGNASFLAAPVISYPLNYHKGLPTTNGQLSYQWNPWGNQVLAYGIGSTGQSFGYPTPLLSDIEFNDAGDMVMAFTDRTGNQYGYINYLYLSSSTVTDNYAVGGDVLIAGLDCSNNTYNLENAGSFTSANGVTYTGSVNNEGPGGGEFFNGEQYTVYHRETSQGALALLGGSGQLMLSSMDPFNFGSGGVLKLSLTNGAKSLTNEAKQDAYQLYVYTSNDGSLGKANGLGDLELLTPLSPTEIGNRVWRDTNANGIQDADEPGIAGVQVQLLAADGVTVLATAITAADGTYYFSNNSGTSTASTVYNITALQPGRAYVLKVPVTLTIGLNSYHLTSTFAGSNRLTDSDASSAGTVSVSAGDIPVDGANNHSFDIGYVPPPTDLTLNKQVDKTEVRHGDTVTYTITVSNQSTVDAAGVEVRDNLPIGLSLINVTATQGTFASGLWTIGSLNAHQTATLTLTVMVD